MKPWNEAYRYEAEGIAASVIGERGYLWKAAEIEKGARSRSEEVEIAMRALMVARGEHKLERSNWSGAWRAQRTKAILSTGVYS